MTSLKQALERSADTYREARFPGDLSALAEPAAPRRLHWPVAIAASVLIVGLLTTLHTPTPAPTGPVAAQAAGPPAPSIASVSFKAPSLKPALKDRRPKATLDHTPKIKRLTSKRLAWSAFPSRKSHKEKTS